MSLAMAVAGLLVALLVGAWMQATRAGTRSAQEAAEDRAEADLVRTLQGVLDGAQWSSASHLPQGAMRWEAKPGACSVWSRHASGLPGPGRWRLQVEGGAMEAVVEDAQGQGQVQRRWSDVTDLRLEVAQRRVEGSGEQLEWLTMDRWGPALPFRPVALRLTWLTTRGRMQSVTAWP